MIDREVFKQVDGKWVSLGIHPTNYAYQLREQLRREGFKVKTEARPYLQSLRW